MLSQAKRSECGTVWGCHLNLLDEQTKFAFYGIKIRLETPEIKIFSVALLSQEKKSECCTVHFWGLDSYRTLYDAPQQW